MKTFDPIKAQFKLKPCSDALVLKSELNNTIWKSRDKFGLKLFNTRGRSGAQDKTY